MRFYHVKCGGEVDVRKRTCMHCKKKWDPVSFRLDPTGIRPLVERGRLVLDKVKPKQPVKSYASWADKLAPVAAFASKLPRWPRWARILVTVAVVSITILIVITVRR